jgi:hypothetical protein
MRKRWTFGISLLILFLVFVALKVQPAQADPLAQVPTGTIPTVTGTPSGPIVTVRLDLDQPSVNVRSGPTVFYDKVGVLLIGQKAVAKGRSAGGDWILIEYPGTAGGVAWVYAYNVVVTPGDLKVVEPPPTATPLYTVTIDPTMAAQFIVTAAPTRLATYTPPPPLVVPTYATESSSPGKWGVPMGMLIIALAAIGLFLGLFALTQGR